MSFVAVLPSIWPPYTEACLTSMAPELRTQILVVDNAPPNPNLGVAASWNRGVDLCRDAEADWLVIVSAAIRFGPPGGLDFLAELDVHPGAAAIEAGWGLGWHLIAFQRQTLERAGRFDENFWPGYYEDLDYSRRIRLAGLTHEPPPFWVKVDVDAYVASFAHAERFAGVKADAPRLVAYYEAKWGGPPGQETFTHPFGDQARGLDWWPQAVRT